MKAEFTGIIDDAKDIRFLYHATNNVNLPAIFKDGLKPEFYSAVHGCMDIHPNVPVVYLSRNTASNNLNSGLFEAGPVSVLKIDVSGLDQSSFYPDDAFFNAVSEGEFLTTESSIVKALGCDRPEAKAIMKRIDASTDDMAEALKPFWRWYLHHPRGGEVSYTRNIPASAIVSVRPHPNSAPSVQPATMRL
jgi:hypothetical protein